MRVRERLSGDNSEEHRPRRERDCSHHKIGTGQGRQTCADNIVAQERAVTESLRLDERWVLQTRSKWQSRAHGEVQPGVGSEKS